MVAGDEWIPWPEEVALLVVKRDQNLCSSCGAASPKPPQSRCQAPQNRQVGRGPAPTSTKSSSVPAPSSALCRTVSAMLGRLKDEAMTTGLCSPRSSIIEDLTRGVAVACAQGHRAVLARACACNVQLYAACCCFAAAAAGERTHGQNNTCSEPCTVTAAMGTPGKSVRKEASCRYEGLRSQNRHAWASAGKNCKLSRVFMKGTDCTQQRAQRMQFARAHAAAGSRPAPVQTARLKSWPQVETQCASSMAKARRVPDACASWRSHQRRQEQGRRVSLGRLHRVWERPACGPSRPGSQTTRLERVAQTGLVQRLGGHVEQAQVRLAAAELAENAAPLGLRGGGVPSRGLDAPVQALRHLTEEFDRRAWGRFVASARGCLGGASPPVPRMGRHMGPRMGGRGRWLTWSDASTSSGETTTVKQLPFATGGSCGGGGKQGRGRLGTTASEPGAARGAAPRWGPPRLASWPPASHLVRQRLAAARRQDEQGVAARERGVHGFELAGAERLRSRHRLEGCGAGAGASAARAEALPQGRWFAHLQPEHALQHRLQRSSVWHTADRRCRARRLHWGPVRGVRGTQYVYQSSMSGLNDVEGALDSNLRLARWKGDSRSGGTANGLVKLSAPVHARRFWRL